MRNGKFAMFSEGTEYVGVRVGVSDRIRGVSSEGSPRVKVNLRGRKGTPLHLLQTPNVENLSRLRNADAMY